MRRPPRWIARLLAGRFDAEVPVALAERLARLEQPLSALVSIGGPLLSLLPQSLRRAPGLRTLERFLLASAELSVHERGSSAPRIVGDPVTRRRAPLLPLATRYELIVVGSGPGGSIAAATAAAAGRNTLVLEEGPALGSGIHPPHSGRQALEQLRAGGAGLVLGSPPALYAEGRTLGGGSEVNSGFYHRLEGERRAAWIAAAGSSEQEWLALECELEERLSVGEAPVRSQNHPLELGALARSLPVERARVWSRLVNRLPEHQGALRTYLADAVEAGARISSGSRVETVSPTTDGIQVTVAIGAERRVFVADELVLAAGAVETPRLLVRSGLVAHDELRFSIAPMLRVAAVAPGAVAHDHLPEPIVARSLDRRYKFATAAGTRPFLRATLRGLGVDPDALHYAPERLFACYASFVPDGSGGFTRLGRLLLPRIDWSARDRAAMREASDELRATLLAGGAERVWPETGVSGVSGVHIGASLPVGSSLVDGAGRLRAEPRIRLSDASLMPGLPWVNPGGPLSVLALLLARRAAARSRT
jgi:choline dehydrogenase-like flavoprotein